MESQHQINHHVEARKLRGREMSVLKLGILFSCVISSSIISITKAALCSSALLLLNSWMPVFSFLPVEPPINLIYRSHISFYSL